MPIKVGQPAVTSSAAKVLDMTTLGIQDPALTAIVTVTNNGSNPCYLGGDNTLTSSNGFLLAAGLSTTVGMYADDALWAISALGTTLGFIMSRVK